MKVLLLALVLLIPVIGQDLNPANFAGAGVTAQRNGGYMLWTNVCKRASTGIYTCAAIDGSSNTTSARAGVETIFIQRGPVTMTIKGDAGLGAAGAISGASYGVGTSLLVDLDWKRPQAQHAFVVASFSALKSTPGQPISPVVRIGLGKAW